MILFLLFWLSLFVSVDAYALNIPTTESGIPKVIHYVWLGSEELPENVKKAVATWRKYQPDFQLKLWNETNCNVNANAFVKESYEQKIYEFASDYCKAKALLEGGVYFDTDMILKAPFLPLLDEPLVFTMQDKDSMSASFMAVVPNHPFIEEIVQDYESMVKFEYDYAPFKWSRHFKKVFYLDTLKIEHLKGKYHIYEPNIMMYDFGGGECVAEHLFGNGSKNANMSQWYSIYRRKYLDQFAFYVSSTGKYFIKKNKRIGYFFDVQTGKASDIAEYRQIYNFYEFTIAGKKDWFLCFSRRCQKLF